MITRRLWSLEWIILIDVGIGGDILISSTLWNRGCRWLGHIRYLRIYQIGYFRFKERDLIKFKDFNVEVLFGREFDEILLEKKSIWL